MKDWIAGNILEHVDITRRDLEIKIGDVFETRLTKQELDAQTVRDILDYRTNEAENDGCFDAYMKDEDTLYIKFIHTGF